MPTLNDLMNMDKINRDILDYISTHSSMELVIEQMIEDLKYNKKFIETYCPEINSKELKINRMIKIYNKILVLLEELKKL